MDMSERKNQVLLRVFVCGQYVVPLIGEQPDKNRGKGGLAHATLAGNDDSGVVAVLIFLPGCFRNITGLDGVFLFHHIPRFFRFMSICFAISSALATGSGSTAKAAPTTSFTPEVNRSTTFLLPKILGGIPRTV